jgi:hypothetical protein
MAPHLEHRRRAIADALRAVMKEPLSRTPAAPTPAAEAPVIPATSAPVAARPQSSGRLLSLRESLTAQIDWDEVEPAELQDADGEAATPPVPPLELDAEMSSEASMALFGHA